MKEKLQSLHQRYLALLMLTILAFAPGMKGWAQALLNENFSYTVGSLLTANGWTVTGTTATPNVAVTAASIYYPGYLSSGTGDEVTLATSGQDVNHTFAAQTTGTVYASCLVNVTSASATGDYFFHLGATTIGSTFHGRVFIKKDAISGAFAFGISRAGAVGTAVFTPYNYTLGTTYLLVLRYTIVAGATNDVASIYINPDLNAVEPVTGWVSSTDNPADLANIGTVALRQGNAANAPALKLDGVRVATTWADIVGSTSVSAPTTQAANVLFGSLASTGFTASWTNGDGSSRAVFIKQGNTGAAVPEDNTTYTANTAFGVGTQIGTSGWYCIYNGAGTSVSVTGLTGATNYFVHVCEYNGSAGNEKYNGSTATGNPAVQLTPTTAVAPSVTSPTATTITANSALLGGNITSDGGSTLTERGTVWSLTSPVTISDNKLSEGSILTGVFTQSRTSLPAGTLIYYAAYATNSAGTSLSPEGSFTTLAGEPTNHATSFAASALNASNITVTWADNDGAQAATGFLILGNKTGTFTAPVDGIDPADDAALADGTGVMHVLHGIQTYTWTTLDASTQYYFSIYPYTNSGANIDYKTDGTIPTANATTLSPSIITYSWIGADGGSWAEATNWSPTRTAPATNDILQFNDGTTKTVTAVPTQTIGQLVFSNNTVVNLQSAAAVILTIAGATGTDLVIPAGSALNLNAINAITINLPTGATGSISGTMAFSSTVATAHRLTAVDAGTITFNSGASFTAGLFFSGSAFGTTALNSIIFASGSTYIAQAGSNPFGASGANSVVVFQTGSLFKVIAGITPSLSGRTYANVEYDFPTGVFNQSGGSGVSIDNLTITNGTLNFNMTGPTAGTHQIKGNIHVATGATLNIAPASAGTVNLNGSALQTISGDGTITTNTFSTININNANGVNLSSNMLINGNLTLTSGLVTLGTGNLTLGEVATIGGTPSASNMIVATGVGELRKTFAAAGAFTYPVGDNTATAEYSPVTLTFTSGTFASAYAGVKLANSAYAGTAASYLNRNWTLSSSGISTFTCDALFNYVPADVSGTEADLFCLQVLPLPVTQYSPANVALHQLSATGISSFGTFTAESVSTDKTLNLKAYLQGYWNGTAMNQTQDVDIDFNVWNKWTGTTVDTLSVYLADANSPFGFVFAAHAVNIQADGSISLTIPASLSDSYYVAIMHRSSVETWSAAPVSFSGSTILYDFTTSASQAFGSNQRDLIGDGSVWGLFGGEIYGAGGTLPADGWVDLNDLNPVYNQNVDGAFGYLLEDITGDGFVDLSDLNLVYNNLVISVGPNTPVNPMKRPRKK